MLTPNLKAHSLLQARAAEHKTVIIFHGLSASPLEAKSLADLLYRSSYNVLLPCLSGHLSSVQELSQVPLKTWLKEAEEALEQASALYDSREGRPIALLGLSFGGLLSLYLAERKEQNLACLVLLAPSLQPKPPSMVFLLEFLSLLPEFLINRLPLKHKSSRESELRASAYTQHSLGALARAMGLRKQVLRGLAKLKLPLLGIQDPEDKYLNARGLDVLEKKLEPGQLEKVYLPEGSHHLLEGPRKEEVERLVLDFLHSRFACAGEDT